MKKLAQVLTLLFSVFSFGAVSQEMEPKNKAEFAKSLFDCYFDSLPSDWNRLGFIYHRKKEKIEGKQVIEINANIRKENEEWVPAVACEPMAPAAITYAFLKNTNNHERKFEMLFVMVNKDGSFDVLFDGHQ